MSFYSSLLSLAHGEQNFVAIFESFYLPKTVLIFPMRIVNCITAPGCGLIYYHHDSPNNSTAIHIIKVQRNQLYFEVWSKLACSYFQYLTYT